MGVVVKPTLFGVGLHYVHFLFFGLHRPPRDLIVIAAEVPDVFLSPAIVTVFSLTMVFRELAVFADSSVTGRCRPYGSAVP